MKNFKMCMLRAQNMAMWSKGVTILAFLFFAVPSVFGQILLEDPNDPGQPSVDVAFAGGFCFSMYSVNDRTGKYDGAGNFMGYPVNAPMSSFDDGPGGIWVQLSVNNQLKVYSLSGSNTHSFLGIANASGTAVRDWHSHWSAAGTTVTRFDQNSTLGSYTNLQGAGGAAYDAKNDVLAVADNVAGKVIILTTGNTPTLITEVIVPGVKDVAFDGNGNLIAAYPNDIAKYLVSGSGNGVTYGAGTIIPLGFLADPVAVDVLGNDIMVAEAGASGTDPRTRVFPNGALPVELEYFTVRRDGTMHRLDWATATEINFLQFEVQQSPDGINWTTIGIVAGTGDISFGADYRFFATPLVGSKSYYRLKRVDLDGFYEFSDVESIEGISFEVAKVFPNPSGGQVTITQPAWIYDLSGRLVWKVYNTSEQMTLPAGTYFVWFIQTKDGQPVLRHGYPEFTKQREKLVIIPRV